jgi:hypothetical protein
MDIKKSIKTDVVLKDARLIDGKIIDDSGEVVNLVEVISKIYGEDEFKLTLTRSTSEEVDIDEIEEIDVNDVLADEE